ncbi:hypothetical protein GCM10010191_33960 [Actinomadura vinacea]|uniref:ESX-1 secretion-associated protein n=1 Tax=Actinomadura vinacea TaxID=115336 RepID=A0ABN3J3C7_9ACTN
MGNKDESKFDVSAIQRSGDKINDAVNLWAGAAADIYNAILEVNALGICGEGARDAYVRMRNVAHEKMNEATTGLIAVRDSVYKVADVYAGTEDETERRVSDVGPARTLPGDIVNPPS